VDDQDIITKTFECDYFFCFIWLILKYTSNMFCYFTFTRPDRCRLQLQSCAISMLDETKAQNSTSDFKT